MITKPHNRRPHQACRFSGKCIFPSVVIPAFILVLTTAILNAAPATQSASSTQPTTRATTQPVTQPATRPSGLTLDLGNDQHLDLVWIPPGSFIMGSSKNEVDRDDSEGPRHRVKIPRGFYMGKYEVTQIQYQTVSGYNQALFRGDDRLPEECVSWTDAVNFCDVLSKRSGKKVRLPSEAEWEYADRAGTKTPFWIGNDLSSTQAAFNGRGPYGNAAPGPHLDKTAVVGSYPANPFGLYDTIGNVSEWCQDVFHDNYTGAPTDGSAWETGGDPEIRVYRGGAYDNDAASCRSAMRLAAERKNNRNSRIGFRIVVESESKR
jgi:formylglycine-generating enzyme required for sulfatase activity